MKNSTSLITLLAICFFSINNLLAQTGNAYADYLINSTPSLQNSWNTGSQGEQWVKEIEQLGRANQHKNRNNADAATRGMNYLNALNGVYNEKAARSYQRRKRVLQNNYNKAYRQAKAYRDYYLQHGDFGRAKYYQNQMNIYKKN